MIFPTFQIYPLLSSFVEQLGLGKLGVGFGVGIGLGVSHPESNPISAVAWLWVWGRDWVRCMD